MLSVSMAWASSRCLLRSTLDSSKQLDAKRLSELKWENRGRAGAEEAGERHGARRRSAREW